MMSKVFHGIFDTDNPLDTIAHEFDAKITDDVEWLFADYSYENYSGSAFVLFRKDGKLYEVNGSHCSCYGLETQWDPEETTKAALTHRLLQGYLNNDHPELKLVVENLEDE